MRKNLLDELLQTREEDLKRIISNLLSDALSGKQWAIELVMQFVMKPLLEHPYRNELNQNRSTTH